MGRDDREFGVDLPLGDPAVTADDRARARRLWSLLECVHTLVYFAPEVRRAQQDLGLPMPQGGYVATRMVGAGTVTPEVAQATLFGFAPAFVHAALPAAWEATTPPALRAAVLDALDGVLAPLVATGDAPLRRAAELAREAAELHPITGRPLAASRASLPWPEPAHLVLWEAATRIREGRGDGHHALAVAAGLDGCEVHLTVGGDGAEVRRDLGPRRGWTDPEWDTAADRLRDRGLLDGGGALTDDGRRLRARLEDGTDALAAPPWRALGVTKTEQLEAALEPMVAVIVDAGVLPGFVTRRVTG